MRSSILSLVLLFVSSVTANTEKVIFMGPPSQPIPIDSPTLDDLQLPELSPRHWGVRTHLAASFPTPASPEGTSSWVLLNGLREGQRYEVRVCWAATEPTVFSITTHPVSTVLSDPDLITSLASYSESQRPDPIALEDHFPLISSFQSSRSHPSDARDLSALFLHIQAAADYYTMNRTLMETVPPVFVDIILDPYLLNVLPRSLVPTVVYILLLAVAAWFIAGYVIQWLQDLNKDEDERVNDKKTS